jgi:Flp pilus assembly protein TadD
MCHPATCLMKFAAGHTTTSVRLRWRTGMATGMVVGALVLGACATPNATERARSLSRMGHDDEAVAVLRKDLDAHPEDVPARRLLVRLLGVTGDLPGARAQAEELGRIKGAGDPVGYIELGHAYELAHRYEEALSAYDTAASVAPMSPDGPREGGLRCARWGEVEEARPRLEEAIRRGANDVELWHALGLVRLHLGDFDGAEQAYRTCASLDPKAPECWLGLATAAITEGDANKALEAYEQVLARRPHAAGAMLGRAWALAKLGRKDEARKALDEAEQMGAPAANVTRQRASLNDPTPPAPLPPEPPREPPP